MRDITIYCNFNVKWLRDFIYDVFHEFVSYSEGRSINMIDSSCSIQIHEDTLQEIELEIVSVGSIGRPQIKDPSGMHYCLSVVFLIKLPCMLYIYIHYPSTVKSEAFESFLLNMFSKASK